MSVKGDGRVAYESVDKDASLVDAGEAGVRPEGEVNRSLCFLVLEDLAADRCAWVGADPQLGEGASVCAAGVERLEQPVGCGSAVDRVRAAPANLDRERIVEDSPAGKRAVEDDRSLGLALEWRDVRFAGREVAEGAECAQVAVVGDRFAASEPELEVGAAATGNATDRSVAQPARERLCGFFELVVVDRDCARE